MARKPRKKREKQRHHKGIKKTPAGIVFLIILAILFAIFLISYGIFFVAASGLSMFPPLAVGFGILGIASGLYILISIIVGATKQSKMVNKSQEKIGLSSDLLTAIETKDLVVLQKAKKDQIEKYKALGEDSNELEEALDAKYLNYPYSSVIMDKKSQMSLIKALFNKKQLKGLNEKGQKKLLLQRIRLLSVLERNWSKQSKEKKSDQENSKSLTQPKEINRAALYLSLMESCEKKDLKAIGEIKNALVERYKGLKEPNMKALARVENATTLPYPYNAMDLNIEESLPRMLKFFFNREKNNALNNNKEKALLLDQIKMIRILEKTFSK